MLVGYMRVSKADGSQTLDLQRDALVAAGVDPSQLYEDRASGRTDDRLGLTACLKALRDGDTLIVWKLDRLGRNLHHLVNTVHDLTAKGVGLKVLTGQGGGYRHHDSSRKARLWDLCCPRGVRARADFRADRRRSRLRSCPGPQRWTTLQDDSG